jgi:hypothetical protein
MLNVFRMEKRAADSLEETSEPSVKKPRLDAETSETVTTSTIQDDAEVVGMPFIQTVTSPLNPI